MIVPIGSRVVIKDHPMLLPHCLAGCGATVVGYADNPPTVISQHHLERDGDVTFKWPSLFSWEFKVIAAPLDNKSLDPT